MDGAGKSFLPAWKCYGHCCSRQFCAECAGAGQRVWTFMALVSAGVCGEQSGAGLSFSDTSGAGNYGACGKGCAENISGQEKPAAFVLCPSVLGGHVFVTPLSGPCCIRDNDAVDLCHPFHGGKNRQRAEGYASAAVGRFSSHLAERHVFLRRIFGNLLGLDSLGLSKVSEMERNRLIQEGIK